MAAGVRLGGRTALLLTLAGFLVAPAVQAQISPFTQSIAAAAAPDAAIAAYYAQNGYTPLWTGPDQAERRNLLLTALSHAADHGLPVQRYDAVALADAFRAARTEGDRIAGRLLCIDGHPAAQRRRHPRLAPHGGEFAQRVGALDRVEVRLGRSEA